MPAAFIYNPNSTYPGDSPVGYMFPPNQYGIAFQTFTAQYTVSAIRLALYNIGSPSGPMTASLYAATPSGLSYEPNGSVLATGSIDQSSIVSFPYPGLGASPQLYMISLSPEVVIQAAQPYIITLTVTQLDVTYDEFGNAIDVVSTWMPSTNYTILWGPNGFVVECLHESGHPWGTRGSASPPAQIWGTLYTPPEPPVGPPAFPPTRPDGYAPDDFWIPGEWNGDVYTPPNWGQPTDGRYFATGGGRWGIQLVAVGHGKIYYEELT